jgi:hypothetical protein
MTIQHVDQPEISEVELEREYALYGELLDCWPDHWFVIVKGELIHAADPRELNTILLAKGVGAGDVLVQKSQGPGPYRVR